MVLISSSIYVPVFCFYTVDNFFRFVWYVELDERIWFVSMIGFCSYVVNGWYLLVEVYLKQVYDIYATEIIGEHEQVSAQLQVSFIGL